MKIEILPGLLERKEQLRLELQAKLDGAKTPGERNRLGQFATPPRLAFEILTQAKRLLPSGQEIRFIDPALGTGAFYSAFAHVFSESQRLTSLGYEIDPHYAAAANKTWADLGLEVRLADFTNEQPPKDLFNLLICNPPYVRHHHISDVDKNRIQAGTQRTMGLQLSGLSGLYCYFLGLSHAWMEEGGIAGWLIPGEFMDVNYGGVVKTYLLDKVRLLHVHRFDPQDVQFGDALVSSAVVWFKKETPPANYNVKFSFGGSLLNPEITRHIAANTLRNERKWTRFLLSEARTKSSGHTLADFFSIRRGLATGNNDFFILSKHQISSLGLPLEFFKPILPSPRYLSLSEINADEYGNPLIDNPLYVLDCPLSEGMIRIGYEKLWHYLQSGKERGVADRYLCRHRTPWYSQEKRAPAPLICTYLGRKDSRHGKPFRFILNNSCATITNVYLALYPNPNLLRIIKNDPSALRHIWDLLNSICPQDMLAEGRVYGGGLHKLEPKELAKVPAPGLADFVGSA